MRSASFLAPLCLTLFLAAVGLTSVPAAEPAADFQSDVTTSAKPWTHLRFQNDPDNFQFAIVSDRAGGPRPGVFEDAVKKLNWLMPEFVLSVGDFIKGNTRNAATNAAEWDEFLGMVAPLKMPFFFVPGNHDIQMKWIEHRVQPEEMLAQWQERFGSTHYSFLYKRVLFLALFSNDGREAFISEEQVAYCEEVLRRHPEVRWTIMLLHHPLWTYPHESNFARVEQALAGRKYTVVAGHAHRYVQYERQGTNYFVLASTGGSSPLRGDAFGEFDHVTWVTMTDDGPILTNLRLDGILPPDVSTEASVPLVRGLDQSQEIGTAVLLDPGSDGLVRGGSVFLTFRNRSDHPLRIDGEFRHHHDVHPRPGVITRVLPPHTSEVVEVRLAVVQPFAASEEDLLELEAVMGLGDITVPGLHVSSRAAIPLATTNTGVFATESSEFIGTTSVLPPYTRDERDIRFTLDGSEPTASSPRLAGPVEVSTDTTIKARVFTADGLAGPVDTLQLRRISAGPGLLARYYEHDNRKGHVNAMPIFQGLPPTCVKRVDSITLDGVARRAEDFAIVYHGWLHIETAGNHGFHLESADGARLLIDGNVIINDASKHSRREASGFARLTAGRHAIEVHFFQSNRDSFLQLQFTPPGGVKQPVPARLLSIDAASQPVFVPPQEVWDDDR